MRAVRARQRSMLRRCSLRIYEEVEVWGRDVRDDRLFVESPADGFHGAMPHHVARQGMS